MKSYKSSILVGAILMAILLLAGCRNPLQVGLGDKIDLDVPDISLTSHLAGEYLSGTVTLGGAYSDDFAITGTNGGITLSFDGGTTTVVATIDPAAFTWSYAVDTTAYADGEVEILLTITDEAGKRIEKRILYFFDNTAPLVIMTTPQGYQTNKYNGLVSVRGEAADIFGIASVEVQIRDDSGAELPLSTYELADGTNAWTYEFDSRLYADPAGSLRLEVKATDRAGNTSDVATGGLLTGRLVHYNDILPLNGGVPISVNDILRVLSGTPVTEATITQAQIESVLQDYIEIDIDNDLDKPTVNIINPADGQLIGGSAIVTGTAFDDDGVGAVQMRLDLNGDGVYDGGGSYFDLNSNFVQDPFEDEQWVDLSGTVVWSETLNSDGSLYNTLTTPPGQVTIQVRAFDINAEPIADPPYRPSGVEGNPQTISVTFDDSIPRIENVSPASGGFARGVFNLYGEIRDDEGIDLVQISYDGGVSYETLYDSGGAGPYPSVTVNAPNDLTLSHDIDTLSTLKGRPGPIDAEPIVLRIRIQDNADPPFQALTYLTVNVDNLAPAATYVGEAASPDEIDDTQPGVSGTATDAAGGVNGIGSVEVYFIREDPPATFTVYDPRDGSAGTLTTKVFSNGTFAYPDSAAILINVDNPDEQDSVDIDGDGYIENLSLNIGLEYNWSARNDPKDIAISDGPIVLHYAVYDKAGNGTHYSVAAFIKNDRPNITDITLGTNLDFSTETAPTPRVEADEQVSYTAPFTIPPLLVRDRLFVDIDATDGGGISSHEVRRQSDDSLLTTVLGDFGAGGAEVDITGESEGATIGLYALVTDSDGITTRQDFDIVIDNVDTIPPTAKGAGSTATADVELDLITVSSVVDGHVEEGADSLDFSGTYDGTSVDDTDDYADVSGTVNITGTAHDDQRIESITLTIAGIGAITLASWDAGAIPPNNRLEYAVDPDGTGPILVGDEVPGTLDPITGHEVAFSYQWDSSDIASVTAEGVTIDLDVDDRASNGPTNDQIIVDVVPYVTGLVRTDAIAETRTRRGKYSLSDGLTGVEVQGYNLNPTWVRIYNSAGTANTGLTPAGVGVPYTSFQVDLVTNYSGYLWIDDGGVLAKNNFNNNNLDQNKQDDGSGIPSTLWNDDLYIQLWDVDNDFQQSDEAQLGSFTVDQNTGAPYAAWSEYSGSDAYWASDTARTQIFGSYDPPEWTDITTNTDGRQYVVYLANFFGGVNNRWGGLVLWSTNADFNQNTGPGNNDPEYREYNAFNEELDWLANDDVLYQFRNARLIAVGDNTDTDVYVSYYDSFSKALKFAHFRDTGGNIYNNTLNLATNATTDNPRYSPDADENIVDGNASPVVGDNVGIYSDIAVDQLGYPVIAFYDTTNTTLRLARATTQDPINYPGDWDLQDVFQVTDPNRLFTGNYVSLGIDAAGNVYVSAYRNSTGDLVYLTAPTEPSGTDYTFALSEIVDAGGVGSWSELALEGTTPHMAYIDGSRADTFYGLKYAYDDAGTWEYGTVPVEVPVASQRVGIEAKPATAVLGPAADYEVALGYNGGLYYFARLRPEQ